MSIELPDFNFDEKIKKLREELKIPDGYFAKYGNTPSLATPQDIVIKALSKSDVKISKSNLLYKEYPDGRRDLVLIHIFSFSDYEPKFHFANCKTLVDQRKNKGFNRYVETHRVDGLFDVDYVGSSIGIKKGKQVKELKVCQNCLLCINYKGFGSHNVSSPADKAKAVEEFNIEEFFRTYIVSLFIERAIPFYQAQSNKYPINWPSISKQTRIKANWQCSLCQIDLSHPNYHQFLDVHHIDRQKFNNTENNLQVLCIGCHSLQPGHERMRGSPRYNSFLALLDHR
ncbi:HNH endonuclease [Acinetobacter brisouii]|uniref:HNH endonuclease n=1 Tax=Acinetobacter brisouii TaxID=396323 RepID=UPI0012502A80|nr:HNH endonuclease signature motif containing protein [Acinetobacter brisouii]